MAESERANSKGRPKVHLNNHHSMDGGWRDIVAGGISGGITRLIIAPLDVIKIRFQVQTGTKINSTTHSTKYHYSGIADSVRTILKEEGIKAFWNGNLLAEMLYIAYVGAQFGSYAFIHDSTMKMVPGERKEALAAGVSFLSGGTAAFISISLTYPLDLLRTRFAAQSYPKIYPSVPVALKSIYCNDGIRGFYSGWGPTTLSLVPSMALQFALYDWAKRSWFGGREYSNPIVHAVAGALSGIISKLAVLPLDVLKKRLQIQGLYHDTSPSNAQSPASPNTNLKNASKAQNSPQESPTPSNTPSKTRRLSLIQIIKHIYKYEGIPGFFRGAVASALKAGVSASLTFTFYEQSKIILLTFMRTIE